MQNLHPELLAELARSSIEERVRAASGDAGRLEATADPRPAAALVPAGSRMTELSTGSRPVRSRQPAGETPSAAASRAAFSRSMRAPTTYAAV
jgi:hypothetical protein